MSGLDDLERSARTDGAAALSLAEARLMGDGGWLNDDYEGGETAFPDIGVRVKGAVGDLLIFHNVTDDGLPDQRMMHAGLPVTSGVKWMASRWIRGQDYLA